MMLGISITEDKIYVNNTNDNKTDCIPFLILRDVDNNTWHIGESAREYSLANKGIIVDKLLYMYDNNSYITISNIEYQSRTIIEYFFRELLLQYDPPEYVVVSLYKNDAKLITLFTNIFENILDKNKVHITSLSEAFIQYVISTGKSEDSKKIGLIDFSNKNLCYYEMNIRKTKNGKNVYIVEKIQNPSVTMDLISGTTGVVVADNILTEFAKRVTKDKIYQHIYLTGEGLSQYILYRDFTNYLCAMCPSVIQENGLFASGTAEIANKIFNGVLDDNIYVTDMRIDKTIKLVLKYDDKENYKNLCSIGDEWYYINKNINLILDGISELNFIVDDVLKNKKDGFSYNLSSTYIDRDDKTNMINLKIRFVEKNEYNIIVRDKGFGDFYENRGINQVFEGVLQ